MMTWERPDGQERAAPGALALLAALAVEKLCTVEPVLLPASKEPS